MDPQAFNSNSRLRASDADRDRAATVLNEALAEGRLTAEEHSARLDSIYAAKTHADLVPLLEDLPATAGSAAPAPASGGAVEHSYHSGPIVAVCGGAVRKGRWRVPRASTVVTVFGGADLDLRDAILPGREITITAVAVFGGMTITVPPEMRVIDSGVAVCGGRDVSSDMPESDAPDAPLLRVRGACVFGGIAVKHKKREHER
jgi:Domain of unknown function (DUF1707)/Cell wall-active antibiotics response 4TMS YvqF